MSLLQLVRCNYRWTGKKNTLATTRSYCTFLGNGSKAVFCTVLRIVKLFEDATCTRPHTQIKSEMEV